MKLEEGRRKREDGRRETEDWDGRGKREEGRGGGRLKPEELPLRPRLRL
ncbi:hypothetical protein [Subsaximicrobium wynnwilliamsii]|nr:hypothetical protein [Subsaximicrobium wynnwilliamsii]